MIKSNISKKQTGSFYTPSYIVDFMVERVFYHLQKNNLIVTKSFKEFQNSILKLNFCDPSIGSGNFIVGLLDKIKNILENYKDVNKVKKDEFFQNFVFDNIYGLELDKNSLHLCKSILKDKFPKLENSDFPNLRCGNSIVSTDVFEYLENDKALKLNPFSWKESFGEEKFFDVIIGNPPYFNLKKMILIDDTTKALYEYLKSSNYWKDFFRSSSDIYYYFVKQSIDLLNEGGILSFIIPNYWMENKYADKLREELLKKKIIEIIDLEGSRIFKDEGKWLNISTCILTLEQNNPSQTFSAVRNFSVDSGIKIAKTIKILNEKFYSIKQSFLNHEKWKISPFNEYLHELDINPEMDKLGDIATVFQGVSPGVKDVFVLTKSEVINFSIENELLVPFVTNSDIQSWIISAKVEKLAILPSRINSLKDFPNVQRYLLTNKRKLEAGPDRQKLMKSGKIRWFDYSVYRNLELFQTSDVKIICPYRSQLPRFALDSAGSFAATDVYAILPKDKSDIHSVLGILNSDFLQFWYSIAGKSKGRMLEFFSNPLKKIPIPKFEIRKTISPLVKELLDVVETSDKRGRGHLENIKKKLNREISNMYGFTRMK